SSFPRAARPDESGPAVGPVGSGVRLCRPAGPGPEWLPSRGRGRALTRVSSGLSARPSRRSTWLRGELATGGPGAQMGPSLPGPRGPQEPTSLAGLEEDAQEGIHRALLDLRTRLPAR